MGKRVVEVPLTEALFVTEREVSQPVRRQIDLTRDYEVAVASQGPVGTCRVRSCDDSVLVLEVSDELAVSSDASLRPIFHTSADGVMRLQSVAVA
jgi:hypothetical protein